MIRIQLRAAMMCATAFLALAAVSFTARAADPVQLTSIDVQTLSGQQVQLKLHMSGPAPEPLPFTIDKPARIAFDLPNTTLALASRRFDVRSGGVDTVLAAEANGRARLVVNVDSLMPYTTKVEGNDIIVTLGQQTGAEVGKPAAARAAVTQSSGPAERAIRTIDFRRGADGTGRVIVQLTDPRTPVNVRQEGQQIVVDFAGTAMPKNLMRRYDVMDFATPVQTVDAIRVDGSSRLVISSQGDFEQLAYQSDNQYTVEIKASTKRTAGAEEKKEYTGERLTLNFQDIDVRSVLQLLADTSGQNIVVSDSVSGNLTLRLQNVPWDQALDIVLRTKGLDKRRQDNVIIIGPTEELATREKAELAAHKEVQELSPTHTEFMQVNYAKVGDLAKLIRPTGGTGGKNSMLSPRGSLSIDERTNTLLVQDTSENLADIRRLVQTLDVPVKQVLIEARIVIVSDTFERDLGARFGVSTAQQNGPGGLLSVSGNGTGANSILGTGLGGASLTGTTLDNRYQVNTPAANTNGSIGISLLGGSYLVDLELSAAQNEGKSETISSPRIITANQKQATIMQGVEIPYQESASSGATTTQFKDAVLKLKVTPLITPDNRVILDLDVSDDSVGQQVTSATGGSVPSIDTRQIVTQVLVNDGQTVVLGGILDTTKSKAANKVPFFGDIPFLGALFRSTTDINNKTELLIFITPKILREGSNLY
ncbi:MAG TPA: type IV pilus secretin PilQ [Steroidobacteraceae bacterium]|jgi:type IV pilus assembly protein PilQ|nr:type IV pilus secretin PilQ [Steroidobacteraceae bacterium]